MPQSTIEIGGKSYDVRETVSQIKSKVGSRMGQFIALNVIDELDDKHEEYLFNASHITYIKPY